MTDRTPEWPEWNELNAYVDGELDPAEAARVARAVAADADTARAVAALAQIKAAAATVPGETPAIDLDRRWRLPLRRIAASLAALVVIGAAVYAMTPVNDEPSWLAAARDAHVGWAGQSLASSARPGAGVYLAAARRLGPAAFVPDLSAAKLSVALVRYRPGGNDRPESLHVGYSGTRGCRVSLWITPERGGMEEALTRDDSRNAPLYRWRAGGMSYVMMSSGMEGARFALVARAAHKATRARREPSPGMRSALRASRAASPPCPG